MPDGQAVQACSAGTRRRELRIVGRDLERLISERLEETVGLSSIAARLRLSAADGGAIRVGGYREGMGMVIVRTMREVGSTRRSPIDQDVRMHAGLCATMTLGPIYASDRLHQ